MDYLLSQPAPSYMFELYVDWMHHYVSTVTNILSFTNKAQEEALVKKISLCTVYLSDLEKRRKPINNLATG